MSDCLCSAKRMSQSFVGFAAPDAVNGRFKTSHLWALQNQPPVSGVRVPILTLPTFVSCSKHQEPTRLSFPARGEGLTSAQHPGRRSLPRVRIAPRSPQASPSSGPSEPGGALAGFEPPGASGAIRSTLETTTVLTVPAKMEVCKEPDHVGLGHLAHGVAGQPLQGEQPGGQLVRRQPIARPAAQLLQRERLPGASTTAAPIRSPHSGSGRPTTATSRTAGCSPIASSTSRAETFTRWRTRVPLRQTGLLREHGFHFAPEVGCGNYCCSPATACLSPTTSYHP